MDSQKFTSSYMNMVLYLSQRDPVFAEYLLARFPPFLSVNPDVAFMMERNRKKWLNNVRFNIGGFLKEKCSIPYDVFVDSVYHLAHIYTVGSQTIPRNVYRANKFIRILKILEDNRYRNLEKQNNQRKRKKKSSQQ